MRYVTTSVARFAAGTVLTLSKGQAAIRSHALKALGDGRYETTAPVEFKVGESFGYDGELPKSLASVIEPVGKPRTNAARKPATVVIVAADAADAADAAAPAGNEPGQGG